jgi:hypothetical protein
MECPDDTFPKLKIYVSEVILDSYEYIPVAYVIMNCMILPRLLIVPCLMLTGDFLIMCSKDHTK